MEATPVLVTLVGKTYTIATDEDHIVVKEAAQLLNQSVQEIESAVSSLTQDKKILFAALQLIVSLLQKKNVPSDVEQKIAQLNELLSSE